MVYLIDFIGKLQCHVQLFILTIFDMLFVFWYVVVISWFRSSKEILPEDFAGLQVSLVVGLRLSRDGCKVC